MRKEFFNPKKSLSDLYMVNCGYEDCSLNFSSTPHTRKYYLIHYVVKGWGYFEVEGKKHKVNAGDIFIIRPNKLVWYYSPDTENTWSFCWIGFSGNSAKQYFDETGIKDNVHIYPLKSDEFLSVISNCLDYVENARSDVSQLVLNHYLIQSLMVLCKKVTTKSEATKALHIVERAVRYVEFNYMNDITPSSISEFFSLDRTYFYRIFKRATGISPEQYIINYRIKKAAELLKSTTYSIGEIASFVGIKDIYYFSKLFKKIKGITPSAYRKM